MMLSPMILGNLICAKYVQLFYFATISIGKPNTPELNRAGLLPIDAILVKYSMTKVTIPWG